MIESYCPSCRNSTTGEFAKIELREGCVACGGPTLRREIAAPRFFHPAGALYASEKLYRVPTCFRAGAWFEVVGCFRAVDGRIRYEVVEYFPAGTNLGDRGPKRTVTDDEVGRHFDGKRRAAYVTEDAFYAYYQRRASGA